MMMPFHLVAAVALAAAPALPVIRPAPDFVLTDQDGNRVKSADFRGKVLLVSFIFTTCNGTCPATTHRLALVHEKIAGNPRLRDKVQFVSISLDPKRDTPEVLRRYRQLYDLENTSWKFLTASPEEVAAVLPDWGMWAKPAPDGQLDHPSRIFLIDPQGRIREIYNLAFLRTSWVLEDMASLLP